MVFITLATFLDILDSEEAELCSGFEATLGACEIEFGVRRLPKAPPITELIQMDCHRLSRNWRISLGRLALQEAVVLSERETEL